MPADRSRIRNLREQMIGNLVLPCVDLFDVGAPEDAKDALHFVMRINRQIFVQAILAPSNKELDPAKAISKSGELGIHAELLVFGTWMVCDRMPGAKKHPGPARDLRKVFKVAACTFAAMNGEDAKPTPRSGKLTQITTKHVVKFWRKCFDGVEAASAYTSNLRSLRHILRDYLACVATGSISFNGRTVTASPALKRLAKAINMPGAAKRAAAAPAAPKPTNTASAPTVARPGASVTPAASTTATFVVPAKVIMPLVYSAPDEQARYRGTVPLPHSDPTLSYMIEPLRATSTKHQLRSDLVDRLVLRPAHHLAGMVSVKALIDRIAVTVSTKHKTSYDVLQRAIRKAGANVYVADRTIERTLKSYHSCLPKVDMSQPTGKHFAVSVQEPTPIILRAVLDTIKDLAGIECEVRPFLIEMALDFYPHPSLAPGDALLAREQIVGLVQRHHWSAGNSFDVPDPSVPRYIDARQNCGTGNANKTRHLFPDAVDRINSDRDLHEETVRQRVLSPKPGNELYLDATIYRGNEVGKRRINNQHKIGDKRNLAKNTFINLPDEQRRARIEITLTSLEALEEVGLRTVDDLNGCKFRTLRRDFLVFRLPTCASEAEEVEWTIAQLTTKGVYGVEMSQRARCLEERQQTKPKRRKTDRDGWGLVDWPEMNNMVGSALDRLSRNWRRF